MRIKIGLLVSGIGSAIPAGARAEGNSEVSANFTGNFQKKPMDGCVRTPPLIPAGSS